MTIKKSSASVLAGILALSVSSFALPAMAAQDQTGAFAVQDGKTAPEENIKDSAKPGDTASDDTADKKDKDKTLADFVEDKEKVKAYLKYLNVNFDFEIISKADFIKENGYSFPSFFLLSDDNNIINYWKAI